MKTFALLLCILVAALLCSCSSPSDPTFMRNAGASINGGTVQSADGRMMLSPGLQNRNRPHPFFGAP